MEWRDVPGWEGEIQVSNTGLVRRIRKWTRWGSVPVSPPASIRFVEKEGYNRVMLVRKGERWMVGVHRLVALAFIGPPPDGNRTVINHIDSNRSNNTVSNLEWCSHAENHAHAVAAGRHARGSSLPQTKLTREIVLLMRARYADGHTFTQLSKTFGLTRSAVRHAVTGKTWSYVPELIWSGPLRPRDYAASPGGRRRKDCP